MSKRWSWPYEWMDVRLLRLALTETHPGDPRKPQLEYALFMKETFVHG